MKLTSISLLFLVAVLAGCNSKSARDYSEKIVSLERSLAPDIQKTEDEVGKYFQSQEYEKAVDASKRMEEIIDDKIDEIERLEPPHIDEADNFKKASLRYFGYMKSIYTAYKEYAMQTSDEGRETERQKLMEVVNGKDDAVQDMQRAQQKFAKANGLKIESK